MVALIPPLGAGLNRVEPAAPRGAPKRLVLEAGWHRQPHRLKGQADRLARTRDGQFKGEIHGVVGTAADQATSEGSAGSGGEQHLSEVRRAKDGGEVKIAVRIPRGRQQRGCRDTRVKREKQFEAFQADGRSARSEESHPQGTSSGTQSPFQYFLRAKGKR